MKTPNGNVLVLSCCLVIACLADIGVAQTLKGRVVYDDTSRSPGTVVYALDMRHRLDVTNNIVMVAEHIPRTITDMQGGFVLNVAPSDSLALFVRDLDDLCSFAPLDFEQNALVDVVIQKPAGIKGQLLKGDEPVKGRKVTARYLVKEPVLRYVRTAVTKQDGNFKFSSLMSGEYLFQVIEEVPQVGCCFRSVVTKQLRLRLFPGQQKNIKLGGTNLPYLHGKITDANGSGLHGVWVRLERQQDDQPEDTAEQEATVVWSDVTEPNGSYRIFDIPAGKYTLHCFRRLALNNYRRTLQATENLVIHDSNDHADNRPPRAENIQNVVIDIESLMPLKYGQPAPAISAALLDGQPFKLTDQRGKVVVLYFYASWCSACVASAPFFDGLADKFGHDKLVVLGINLDKTLDECKEFIAQKGVRYPQLFAGPWTDSPLRKTFHVVDVPTTFVIDADGKVAHIDIFGKVLEKFIEGLLK
ncbi:MAG: redoxin domain-containing protein [Planctomycetota bacterium]|jgi:peroxiredoxin